MYFQMGIRAFWILRIFPPYLFLKPPTCFESFHGEANSILQKCSLSLPSHQSSMTPCKGFDVVMGERVKQPKSEEGWRWRQWLSCVLWIIIADSVHRMSVCLFLKSEGNMPASTLQTTNADNNGFSFYFNY